LGKILVTAADPDASAIDLGQHIAADQSLSAIILRLVNSSYYGFYRQITSVSEAIVMLGFIEVRNLTLTATAFKTVEGASSKYDRVQLWRHALATAMAAEQCAKKFDVRVEGAFESGLLHDIGKVILDLVYPDEFVAAVQRAHEEEASIAEIEEATFGLNHATVGGILGEHWHLPPAVSDAIRYHHAPEDAGEEPVLAQITCLANYVSYLAELGDLSNGKLPEFPEGVALALNASREDCQEVADTLGERRGDIDDLLGALQG
jgi:putative nucleotidyltransferase with HDIG domain